MLYSLVKNFAACIIHIFFGIEVSGKGNIPRSGGFILASNHVSYLDPIALSVACPRKLNFMARHDLFFNPFFAWLISSVGAFPVKRDSADLSALKEAMQRLKRGGGLLLFPEGTRQAQGISDKPHAGIGFLSAKTNVPVIPAFVKGTEKAWPRYSKAIHFHKIYVYFGREIPLERGLPYADISRRIMQEIRQLSCSVSN